NNNLFQQLRMHDGMANGWYLTKGASNVVLNCDAYNNKGLDSGSIGNTDGFGCRPAGAATCFTAAAHGSTAMTVMIASMRLRPCGLIIAGRFTTVTGRTSAAP